MALTSVTMGTRNTGRELWHLSVRCHLAILFVQNTSLKATFADSCSNPDSSCRVCVAAASYVAPLKKGGVLEIAGLSAGNHGSSSTGSVIHVLDGSAKRNLINFSSSAQANPVGVVVTACRTKRVYGAKILVQHTPLNANPNGDYLYVLHEQALVPMMSLHRVASNDLGLDSIQTR